MQQLELIEVQEEDKIQAINDCLRAEIDRTKWSQGIIHESSLDDLWSTLSTFWKNKNAQNAITHKHLTIVEQANILYRDCMMLRLPLEGLEVPNHFTPESFHTLADDEEVGWHRDYKNLLATRRMAGHNEHAEQRTPRRQHEPTLTPITHRINVSLRRGSLKVDISPPNLSTAAGVIIQREIVTRHGLAIGISEYPRWIPFSVQTWLSQIEIAQRLGKFL